MRALDLHTFAEYHALLTESGDAAELTRFINAMTTNKTDFFREAHHFRYLTDVWAPEARARSTRGEPRMVRMWSAGCSTGEEPYTLAVTLHGALGTGWDIKILASDIDTDVLERARRGLYTLEQVAPVPQPLLQRYFQKGRGASEGLARVRPEIADLVTFRRVNFLDEPWPVRGPLDAIFCRNVLIYFDRPTQQRVLTRLVSLLKDDGLLFLGHSESAHGLLDGVAHVGNTIYHKTGPRATRPPGR